MRPLLISICSGVLVLASGSLVAAGDYQTARDGKTLVWNATPKAGDSANWSGGRDKDNYATGFGDLAWYNASGKEDGLYYGNMVHGKFEGVVNVHTAGRTMHAYFAGGGRVTSWSRGRAPTNMKVPDEVVAEKRKAVAEAEKEEAKPAEPEPTVVTKKAKPVAGPVAKTEPSPAPTDRATRGPDTYHKETAAKTPTVAEKKVEPEPVETPPTLHEPLATQSPKPSIADAQPASTPDRAFSEPTAFPKSTAAPENVGRPTPDLEHAIRESTSPAKAEPTDPEREVVKGSPPPVIEETPPVLKSEVRDQPSSKPETTAQQSPVNKSAASSPSEAEGSQHLTLDTQPPESPADVSVDSLVGPPSSLRTGAIPEGTPENPTPSPTPKREGPLTEPEVVSLVESDARANGAPIDQYDQPTVDHSAVKGKWTLFYARKADTGVSVPPAFTATVDDKTHKVNVQIHH